MAGSAIREAGRFGKRLKLEGVHGLDSGILIALSTCEAWHSRDLMTLYVRSLYSL